MKTGDFANSERTSSGSVSECASYRLLTEVRSYDHGGDDEHAAACTAWHYRIDPYREAAENRYPSASGSLDILAVLGEKVVPDSVLARHVNNVALAQIARSGALNGMNRDENGAPPLA